MIGKPADLRVTELDILFFFRHDNTCKISIFYVTNCPKVANFVEIHDRLMFSCLDIVLRVNKYSHLITKIFLQELS
jgi:hypothetical protein